MFQRILRLALSFWLLPLLAIVPAERADAGVSIVDRQLVATRRVGRTVFDYTYTLSMQVDGPALDGAYVYVLCDNAGTTITDNYVEFGDVPGNATTTSSGIEGTFTLRQNRRIPFDESCLDYDIGFEETLVLSGVATDLPINNARITGTITWPSSGRPVIDTSGRPVIETFTTTADANGAYSLSMPVISMSGFVTLTAEGVAGTAQEGAMLTSTVGSIGSLHDVGAEGSIIVGPAAAGSLNITHITTAQDELVRRLNGGPPPASDAELAALQAQVDGAELVLLATLIKTIIDNPGIPLPPGFSTTLELIQDEAAADAYALELQSNFPDEWQAALESTADTIGLGYVPGEVPGTLYASVQTDRISIIGSYVFEFNAQGGGTVSAFLGSSDIAWSIDAEGNIVVDLLNPPVSNFFVFRDPPGGSSIPAARYTDRLTLVRIADNQDSDQVFVLERTVTTFPDNPEIADEIFESTPGAFNIFYAFRESGIQPFLADELTAAPIATYYYNEGNGVANSSDPNLGADLMTFDADGSGVTARLALVFNWTIDDDGSLLLIFDNGDTNRLVRFRQSGIVYTATLIGEVAGTSPRNFRTQMIPSDGVAEFSEATVDNREYTAAFSSGTYRFLPGGSGCRGPWVLSWESTPDNFLDFLQVSNGLPLARSTWQAVAVEPGVLGDRYWVIENLDINNFADPNWPSADPFTLVDRLGAYEFSLDLSNEIDPCGP